MAYDPRFYRDAYGTGENLLSMATGAIAEPVSGIAALLAAAQGYGARGARDAIREKMTYQPRSAAGVEQAQMLARLAQGVMESAPVRTWQRGVDIAGRYSPAAGAALQAVPTAIGVAAGYKPTMAQGRAASMLAEQMQNRIVQNAMAPRTLHPQAGVFAGISAIGANLNDLSKAKKMMMDGVSPEKIWKDTGWLQAKDGKWRYEIPDAAATFIKKENGKLYDVLKHDALYEAYPQLKNIDVDFDASEIAGAHYSGENGGRISLNSNFGEGILLHEIQHEIQDIEGFSPGGSPNDSTIYNINGRQYFGAQAYERLLGEIEANLVQERKHKFNINDVEELREYYPYEDPPHRQTIPKPIIVKERK